MGKPIYTQCFCQVLKHKGKNIYIYLRSFMEDGNEEGVWIPRPPGMPDWCLDSNLVFDAEIFEEIETLEQLRKAPWSMMGFCLSQNPIRRAMINRLSDEEWSRHIKEDLMPLALRLAPNVDCSQD